MRCLRLRDKNTIVRFPSWALRIRGFSHAADYLPAHCLGDECFSAVNTKLEHSAGDSFAYASRLYAEEPCDLLGCKALGN